MSIAQTWENSASNVHYTSGSWKNIAAQASYQIPI